MSDPAANTTLAVLAGGEGSRMGQPKGLLTVAGRPILEYLLQTIHWPGPTLLVTSPNCRFFPGEAAFDVEVVDLVSGQGPLRGILTALQHARTETIVVTPVDMPAIGFAPLHWLAEQLHQSRLITAMMLRQHDEIQPLPAAFRKSAIDIIEHRLAIAAYSLRALAQSPGVAISAVPDSWSADIWTNLNFPSDLARFEQKISGKLFPDEDRKPHR